MSNGVLILAHGSRRKSTEAILERVADMVRERLPDTILETAYMEFGEKNIESGIQNLIHKGVDEIVVAPYFLFDGIHIREDIPRELNAMREKYPRLKIIMGEVLGADERLADIVADRVRGLL